MRANLLTKIKWYRMINVKDCKSNCKCANNLRKTILRIPLNKYEDKIFEKDIKIAENYQIECLKKNKIDKS